MPEDALFIERDTALRLQIVSDVRPGGDLVMQRGDARKASFEPRHRARERIAQPGNELKQRQVAIADPPSDQIAVGPRVALDDPLEIAEIFRNAIGDKIGGAAARFLPLVLVIEGRGDRVMRIVGFVDDIGDCQLQLMRPEPSRLVARPEPVTPPAPRAAPTGAALDYPPKQRQHAHWPGPCINTALILQGAPGLSKL